MKIIKSNFSRFAFRFHSNSGSNRCKRVEKSGVTVRNKGSSSSSTEEERVARLLTEPKGLSSSSRSSINGH